MTAFQTLQRQFLAHLRNPDHQPLPAGFAEQGTAVYANLLYNKFNGSLEQCFPMSHEVLGETAWQQLLKTFIAEHCCKSPYYRQIPDEFIRYLQTERCNESDPPYLPELAHFEWKEMILAIAEADPATPSTAGAVNDWSDCRPLFAPVFELLHYVYPVQHINASYNPATPPEQTTHILGFRDSNDVVQFIELQSATARLLDVLQSTGCTIREAIESIAAELEHPNPSALFSFGIETMTQLMQQGAILGVQNEYE